MADHYGNVVQSSWKVYISDYNVTDHGTWWGIDVTMGVQMQPYHTMQTSSNVLSYSFTDPADSSRNVSSSTNQSIDITSAGGWKQFVSTSWWVWKGHSAKTVTLTATLTRSSGYASGSSSVTAAFSVAAISSYAYSFDANGGSGAPDAQTKWQGESFTFPSVKPTRTNYSFLGWATSSGATSADYQPGTSYSGLPDSATTYHAVWHLDHVAPSINSFSAYRASDSTGTASQTGGYAYLTCAWAKGSSSVTGITVTDSASGTWTSYSVKTGSSGTFTAYRTLAATESIAVTITIADGTATTVRTATIGTTSPPIDVGNKGKALGLLCLVTSSDSGLYVHGSTQKLPVDYDETYLYNSTDGFVLLQHSGHVCTLLWNFQKGNTYFWQAGTIAAPWRPSVLVTGASVTTSWSLTSGTPTAYDHDGGYVTITTDGAVTFCAPWMPETLSMRGSCSWIVK